MALARKSGIRSTGSGKQKACKACRNEFRPRNSLQKVCSPRCAIQLAVEETRRKRRAETRELRAKLRETDRSYWLKVTQTAVNEYIRFRDRNLPCVSCDRHHNGQWHAGHYRPAGNHSRIRFDERNIHRQCMPCNSHKSGDLVLYRRGLLERVGIEVVDWLEQDHEPKRWEIDELKAIRTEFRSKLRQLKRENQ